MDVRTHSHNQRARVIMTVCVYIPYNEKDVPTRGGGLGSRLQKMYGERLGDGVEYHLMKPTPRC